MTHNVLNLRITPASSLIEFLEYNNSSRELVVKFKRGKYKGKERKYSDISSQAFEQVMESESVGKSIIKLIEGKKGVAKNRSFFGRFLSF